MSVLIWILALVSVAVAQMTTTSFPFPFNQFGTDKIGFFGSVVDVKDDHTTLVIRFDNGTDARRLSLATFPSTLTLGKGTFDLRKNVLNITGGQFGNGFEYKVGCSVPGNTAEAPSCTESYGPELARTVLCETWTWTKAYHDTLVHYYSGRSTYSEGEETIIRSVPAGPSYSTTPEWCKTSDFFPSSGYTFNPSVRRADIATYQLVITAGAEKLSATQGAGGGTPGATPTAGGDGSTGAAMPMKTMGPMGPVIAGLGAAAAVFL